MPDLLAGTTVRGLDTPPTVSDEQPGTYTFTNTSYGVGSTGGTYVDCAVVFTAPTTGRIRLTYNAQLINTGGTSGTRVAPAVREGATVGSGAVVVAADDANQMLHVGTSSHRSGASVTVTGLTPGNTYNARLEHRVGSSTGTASNRTITAVPVS